MKKTIIALVLFALIATLLGAETSAFYPVRVDVVRVYSHTDGYMVVYRKGQVETAAAYIPMTWFTPGAGWKAELIQANDPSHPYLVVYFKEGKFDHVKLYVRNSLKDSSWGVLEPAAGKGKFDVEELKLQF